MIHHKGTRQEMEALLAKFDQAPERAKRTSQAKSNGGKIRQDAFENDEADQHKDMSDEGGQGEEDLGENNQDHSQTGPAFGEVAAGQTVQTSSSNHDVQTGGNILPGDNELLNRLRFFESAHLAINRIANNLENRILPQLELDHQQHDRSWLSLAIGDLRKTSEDMVAHVQQYHQDSSRRAAVENMLQRRETQFQELKEVFQKLHKEEEEAESEQAFQTAWAAAVQAKAGQGWASRHGHVVQDSGRATLHSELDVVQSSPDPNTTVASPHPYQQSVG